MEKNAFLWSEAADQAFQSLKRAVTNPPVSILLDLSQPFVIECDASGRGIGSILMQTHRSIAFFRQVLKGSFFTNVHL